MNSQVPPAFDGSRPFDPHAVARFCVSDLAWDDDRATAVFTYDLRDAHGEAIVRCHERYEFPPPATPLTGARRVVFQRLLAHLCVIAGISYYKLAAPQHVEIEPAVRPEGWSAADVDLHRLVLTRGLGEYCFMNDLPAELWPSWSCLVTAAPEPINNLGLNNGPLVPVGGGKDSCVSIEALRNAGFTPTLVTVNRYPVIAEVIADANLPDLAVRRVLDPQLTALNDAGARNGHVPATAIVSFAVLACAVLHGHDAVVMSNERSASEGNVVYRGVEINHQWSKSEEAEDAIRATVASITPELTYFSLLRPLSELGIARRFASTCQRYFGSFSSCNAAFRLDPARRVSRWCGQCPKCQFVYLALATVLPPEQLVDTWGSELFASSPSDGFRALLGIAAWKPFECVGESAECRVALRLVVESDAWKSNHAAQSLADEVRAAKLWPTDNELQSFFTSGPADIPNHYAHVLGAS